MTIHPRRDLVDAGLDWIGPVPSSWKVRRLGHYFDERREKVSDKDFAPLSVTMKGVVPQLENVAKTDDGENRKLVRSGDFVINSRSDRKGSGGIAPTDGSVSLINTVLATKAGMRPQFAAYLLTSYPFQEEFYRVGNGIVADMWTTKYGEMKNIRLAVPDHPEQDAIVSYLDRATTRIDALIAKKTRFIELLREKRQALITHAVTKGLDAGVPMKDSGVEWLGEIPSHWAVKRLKRVATIDNSGCYGSDEHGAEATVLIKTCTTAHISADSRFIFDGMEERFFSPAEASRYTGAPGDIFVVKSSGSNTNIISGKLARVRRDHPPVVFTNFLMRVRPDQSNVEPEFLEYFLSSTITRRRIERMVATTTYPNINVSEYASALIPIPPLNEQWSITAAINSKVSHIDTLIAKTERSIELLREHRTALITAAVTGKIDLRNAA